MFWMNSALLRKSPILSAVNSIVIIVSEPFSYMYLIRVFIVSYCFSSLLREIWSDASRRYTSLFDSSISASVSAILLLSVTKSWLIPSSWLWRLLVLSSRLLTSAACTGIADSATPNAQTKAAPRLAIRFLCMFINVILSCLFWG